MEKVKVVNNKTKLKVNDNVVVVSGADRGKPSSPRPWKTPSTSR